FVAEGGVSKQVEPLVRPVRAMFAAIFFVAIGMSIQPTAVLAAWPAVLGLTAAVLIGKTVGVTTGGFIAGLGTRTSVRAALSMGQIGEFSFIIAGLGVATGATGDFLIPVAVSVSVVTSLLTPALVSRSTAIANFVDRRMPHALQTYSTLYGSWVESVRVRGPKHTPAGKITRLARFIALDALLLAPIIVGLFLVLESGTDRLAAFLGLSTTVVEAGTIALALAVAFPLLYGIVRAARSLGEAISLHAVPAPAPGRADLGAAPRRALRLTVQIGVVVIVGVPIMAVTLPVLPAYGGPVLLLATLLLLGIAFWRSARDLQGHVRAGATMIVEALAVTREHPAASGGIITEVRQMLPGIGELTQVVVGAGDAAAGQTLAKLNLRGLTGASVVALCRGEDRLVLPEGGQRLEAGDVLALTGSQRAIQAATAVIQGS
ncbi:MAG TPA: cation:proton antiporter, partial [Gemmatimonadales bacterium]|nr:cation:proton antiporter [Gemmatimonadales bacterium]